MARPARQLAAATARLALFGFGVALATSRLGLLAHELCGHGGAALAYGVSVTDWRFFWFAGGWVGYEHGATWTWTSALVVSMAGIAVELAAAAALALVAVRIRRTADPHRPGRAPSPFATALAAAALGLALHAACYLCTGALDGYGDGDLLYQRLGAARLPFGLGVAAAAAALGFVGARRLARDLRAWLPAGRGQLVGLAIAVGLAGGLHAGLAAGEVGLRRDRTYHAIMETERDRGIDRDVAAWQTAQVHAGHPPDAMEISRQRRQLERERPARRLTPLVLFLVIAATATGTALGRPRQAVELTLRAAIWAVTTGVLATLTVGVIDALSPR